jgi:hypothetical protein
LWNISGTISKVSGQIKHPRTEALKVAQWLKAAVTGFRFLERILFALLARLS